MSQTFLRKYRHVESQSGGDPSANMFKATVEALELDGIHLLNPEKSGYTDQLEEDVEETGLEEDRGISRRLTLKEIFAMEKEREENTK